MKNMDCNHLTSEIELIFADNQAVFREKKKVSLEKWISDSTGKLKLLSITKTPKLNKNGEVASVFCTAIDITEKASLKRHWISR